jgi:hypothetical protein
LKVKDELNEDKVLIILYINMHPQHPHE